MGLFRSILVVDDEASIRHVLTYILAEKGYEVRAASDGEMALKELAHRSYDVVVTDVRMPQRDGLSLLKAAKAAAPDLVVIVMSAYGSEELALKAVSEGAWDYVQKPFKPEEILLVIQKAEERARLLRENVRLKHARGVADPLMRMLGSSEPLQQLRRQIEKVAPVTSTVLIQGESGTGKELVARALHELSPRAAQPFVTVNCGAISPNLIESELFGHVRGAFTDARSARTGLLVEADQGTLFLDEIGELPMPMQVKLLRFLQEGEVRPVGDSKSIQVEVRVVAATLRDLAKLVEKGEFREDLFFRLNVVSLRVPPLRERKADIPVLAAAFIARFNREMNREHPVLGVSPEAAELLAAYAWPGNVRELENAMERAVLLCDGEQLLPEHLPEKLMAAPEPRMVAPVVTGPALPVASSQNLSLKKALAEVEETFIRAALKETKGNRTRAAILLEISHRALLYKIKDYGIDIES